MRWVQGNATRLALLGHYALVVAASAWLHDHAHVAPERHVAQAAGEHACCPEPHRPTAPTDPQVPSPSDQDHACPVCEFLLQKPIPVENDATWHPAVLVRELVWEEPVRAVKQTLSPWQVRGPPAVA